MSSDNFYLIRRAGDRYAVSMEFASDEEDAEHPAGRLDFPQPIDSPRIAWFDDHTAAVDYAFSKYSEYGVSDKSDSDQASDTRAERLSVVATELALRYELESMSWNEGSVVMDFGPVTVTIAQNADTAGTKDQTRDLAEWIMATAPEALAPDREPSVA